MDDALEMLLGRYAGSVGHAPSAIAATFAYALARLEDAGLVHGLDEETTTAAFLGAFAGGYPLCRALTGTAPESPDCAWGQYNKSGFRDAWKTESRRGADFAMVVWTSATHARLALFQAKKSDIPTEDVRNALAATLHARARAPALPGIPTVTPAPGTCFVNVHRPAPAAYFEDADLAGVDPASPSPVSQLQALVATARQMEEAAELVHAGHPDAPSWITHLSERPIEVPPEEAPKGQQLSGIGDVARWRKVRESEKQQNRKATAREQLRSARHATGRQAGPASVDDIDWIHYLAYAQGDWNDTADVPDVSLQECGARAVCIPLYAFCPEFDAARSGGITESYVDLAGTPCHSFADVLLAAVREPSGDSEAETKRSGWLTVDTRLLTQMLPVLQTLTTVVVATDKGGDGLVCVNAAHGGENRPPVVTVSLHQPPTSRP